MRNTILVELSNRWTADANDPGEPHEAFNSEVEAAKAKAIRETKRECADTLLSLMQVLPD